MKKGETHALWFKIKSSFPVKSITKISLNEAGDKSVIVSDIEKCCFDDCSTNTNTCGVDMIDLVNDELILTEFKDGSINHTNIYRKAVESILVTIKNEAKDKDFNPFKYNFKFHLVYSLEQVSSDGAQNYRIRSQKRPFEQLLAPMQNHLYREAIAIHSSKYKVPA